MSRFSPLPVPPPHVQQLRSPTPYALPPRRLSTEPWVLIGIKFGFGFAIGGLLASLMLSIPLYLFATILIIRLWP